MEFLNSAISVNLPKDIWEVITRILDEADLYDLADEIRDQVHDYLGG